MTRSGSKRVIRVKTSMKEGKHTDRKSVRGAKHTHFKGKKKPVGKPDSSVDSQADKENNVPTTVTKKRQLSNKAHVESTEKKTQMESNTKSVLSGSKHKKKYQNKHKSPVKVVEIEESDEEPSEKPVTKRVALKKTEAVLNESASKISVNESNKEISESIKTPTSSDLPKNGYGLRRRGRGRKPKKSHIYKSEENLIYSHEKDEEMHKHDDSEFKLPNEDKVSSRF